LNIVIDWIGKTAYNEPHGIRWSFISRLEDLEFSDDICTLSHRFQDSQHQATRLEETAKRTGLYINSNKTKSMKINANRTDSIQINNTDLENISNFTYLGSIISTTGALMRTYKLEKRKHYRRSPSSNLFGKAEFYGHPPKSVFSTETSNLYFYMVPKLGEKLPPPSSPSKSL
jgi:hypothetical protein